MRAAIDLTAARACAAARALGMSIYGPGDAFEMRWGKALVALEGRAGQDIWRMIAERRDQGELASAVLAAHRYRERRAGEIAMEDQAFLDAVKAEIVEVAGWEPDAASEYVEGARDGFLASRAAGLSPEGAVAEDRSYWEDC